MVDERIHFECRNGEEEVRLCVCAHSPSGFASVLTELHCPVKDLKMLNVVQGTLTLCASPVKTLVMF